MHAKAVNGEVCIGDVVISNLNSDYACLVGRVTNITQAGSKEQEEYTGNETDDIWVDFTVFDYSRKRIKEIEDDFRNLYRDPTKVYDELPLDMVAMSGDELLKIPDSKIDEDFLRDVCESFENAKAWCMDEVSHLSGAK